MYAPSFRIHPVDTTAAEDAFIGGLAVSLLDPSSDVYASLRFTNAAGAVAATRLGAQSSLPIRSEVEALMACDLK